MMREHKLAKLGFYAFVPLFSILHTHATYDRIGDVLIVRRHAAKPIAIHALPELQAGNVAPGN